MKTKKILLIGLLYALCFAGILGSANGIDGDILKKGLGKTLNMQLTGRQTSFVDHVTGVEHKAYRISGSVTGNQFAGIDTLAGEISSWFESQAWESELNYLADGPSGTSFAYKKDQHLAVISVLLDESELTDAGDGPLDLSTIPPGKLKYDLEIHIFNEDPAASGSDSAVPDITLRAYLIPLIVSNLIALLLILICLKWPGVGRVSWIIIFLAAGLFNIYTANTNAQAYLMYGKTAVIPFYKQFIAGLFSRYTALFVTLIGSGQILVAVLMMLRRPAVFPGIMGGILFLLAITPLGLGSAFPCTLFMAASLLILFLKLKNESQG